MFRRIFLVPAAALALAVPGQAGVFRKSPRPDPAIHVPALVEALKANKDEKVRAAAAGELDEYDAKAYPDVLPALIEALATDPSVSVRARAAESIGKVRPISAAAGYALERAAADDKSFRVQVSARAALVKYRVLGHIPGVKIDTVVQTTEPPLATGAGPKGNSDGTVLRPTPAPVPVTGPVTPPVLPGAPTPKAPPGSPTVEPPTAPQTGEPPLARPGTPAVTTAPKEPRPIIVIPSPPEKGATPTPTVPASTGGPTLPPPQPASGPKVPPKQ